MNEKDPIINRDADIDFPLWRLLDITRYMIFRFREQELANLGITPEQAFVLDIIRYDGGSTTINQIVTLSQRKHNSISALINRMSRQGLLRKSRTRRDKRAFRILSTPKGEQLLEKIPLDSIHNAFACLESDEKAQLAKYLARLMRSAFAAIGNESPYDTSRLNKIYRQT
jgi:DNA-binding MarR family transcriptional regulator